MSSFAGRDASGKQRWHVVDGGIKAARAALAIEHAKRAKGERVAPPRLTFAFAVDAAWAHKRHRLARSSQVVYEASRKRVRDYFGSRRLGSISTGDVAAYVAAHERLSAETLRKDLSVIGRAFAYAIRHLGFTGANPVQLLDRIERPHGEGKPKRILETVELRELLMATEPRFRLALRFLAETGVRLSQLLGLAWGEIDLDAEMIEVVYQLEPRTGQRVKLKTARSRRSLAVTGELTAELRDARPEHVRKHEFVFCDGDGMPYNQKQIERAVRRAAERAGLGDVMSGTNLIERAPTPHDLRHSHASALIAARWDVDVSQSQARARRQRDHSADLHARVRGR